MDGGGLNGSMMDPMKMSDAELLEAPLIPEPTIEQVNTNIDNSGEIKMMQEKLKTVEQEKNNRVADIENKNKEILSLREAATNLTKENASLNEKAELNEDELMDLREQFGEMEKDAEQSALKIKELTSLNVKMSEKVSEHEKEKTNLLEGHKTLETKIKTCESEMVHMKAKQQLAASSMETLQTSKKQTEEKLVAQTKLNEQLKISKTKLDEKIASMDAETNALTRRNQEVIGDKNKKLADLNTELTTIKSNLAAKESKCLSAEQKSEEMKTNFAKKEKEVQDLLKTISDLKQSSASMGEKEKEISSLKLKMEEITLKQKNS